MSTVDQRLVELGFNNKGFEDGVAQSTKSLENLKQGLDLSETTKGLTELQKTGNKFNLSSMSEGVQNVSSKFSAMGVIGFTVIQNLTNAAIAYGKKIVTNFTKPMKEGFAEYETQMNAIQTVLANTKKDGTTLQNVTDALAELNEYADLTIYNFTEMTKNVGTFTAAGVDLDTSVAAIKGIANLAAVSGSNSQQAATAMYQLSQALSSGTVKLMDWNSVVNAGMGGQVFQDALIETARAHDIAIDQMLEQEGSFRETLQKGWLTSEVLTETLQKFTGDLSEQQLIAMGYTQDQIAGILELGQTANDAATKVKTFTQLKETIQEAIASGWTESWAIIIGDFEEAKLFFTEISDTLGALIGDSADARNTLLRNWKKLGGRDNVINSLWNSFNAILAIMAPIKEAFSDIFPDRSLQNLIQVSRWLEEFTAKLIISEETADQVRRIFAGVFAALSIGKDILLTLTGYLLDFISTITSNVDGGGILEFFATLGDSLVELSEDFDFAEIISNAIATIQEQLLLLRMRFAMFRIALFSDIQALKDKLMEFFAFDEIDTSGAEAFLEKLELRFEPLQTLGKAVGAIISGIFTIGKKLAPLLVKLGSGVANFAAQLAEGLGEALGNVDFVTLFDNINAGLIAALLAAVTRFVTKGGNILDDAGGMFEGLADILDGVGDSLQAWQQNLKAKTLLLIAAAIGILAISLIALASVDSKKLTVSLGIITGLFANLIASMAALGKFGGGGLLQAGSLIGISIALLALAGAMKVLADIDQADMDKGLGAIFALMAGLVIFSKFMSKDMGSVMKGSLGLIAFAIGLRVLVEVVKELGNLKPHELTNGLLGVGVMLAELAAFMKIIESSKMSVTSGIGILALSAAILVLATSVEKFGNMDLGVLKQGLVAMGLIFLQIGLFTRLSGDGKGMVATAIGVTILAGAMFLLTEVLDRLGQMSPEEIGKGLIAMAGALGIITIAMRAMPKNMIITAIALVAVAGALLILSTALENMGGMTWEEIGKGLLVLAASLAILTVALYAMSGTLAGSAALLVASGALMMLAHVMQVLGSMPLIEIGIALLALAGIFVIMGVAGLVLTPLVPTLLGLGAAMLLIGAGAALVGLGLLAFSAGLAALAVSGSAGAVALVAIISTLAGLFPVIINALIDGIIVFAKGIAKAAPEVGKAMTALLLMVLQTIIDVAPSFFEALKVILLGLIDLIVEVVPDFVEAMGIVLMAIIDEIVLRMPEFVQAGFDILLSFLNGILDNIGEVVTTVVAIVVAFIAAVAEELPDIIQSGYDLMIAFIDGMADGIDNNMQPVLDAIGRLATSIMSGLLVGLENGAQAIINWIVALAKRMIASIFSEFESESPSKVMIVLGESIPQGILVGMQNLTARLLRGTETMAEKAIDTMGAALDPVSDILTDELNMDPVIRPVVDMDALRNDISTMDKMFANSELDLAPAIQVGSVVASNMKTPTAVGGGNVDASSAGDTYNFEQNNYSPKPLSQFELYRQTNNQFLALKGAVDK